MRARSNNAQASNLCRDPLLHFGQQKFGKWLDVALDAGVLQRGHIGVPALHPDNGPRVTLPVPVNGTQVRQAARASEIVQVGMRQSKSD